MIYFELDYQAPIAPKTMDNEIRKDLPAKDSAKRTKLDGSNHLSAEDLLAVSRNISLYFRPIIPLDSKKLVLLPVDTQTLYVYWSLGEIQSKMQSQGVLEKALVVRVDCHFKEATKGQHSKKVYEARVQSSQAGQSIKMPKVDVDDEIIYTASIGNYRSDKTFTAMVSSNNIEASRLEITPAQQVNSETLSHEVTHHVKEQNALNDELKPAKTHYASTLCSGQGSRKER